MRNKITVHIALYCLLAAANAVVASENQSNNPLNQSLMTLEDIVSGESSPYISPEHSPKGTPPTSGHNSPRLEDFLFFNVPLDNSWYEMKKDGSFSLYDDNAQKLCELRINNTVQKEIKQLTDTSISTSQRSGIEIYLKHLGNAQQQLKVYLLSNDKTFCVDISSALDTNKKSEPTITTNIIPLASTSDQKKQSNSSFISSFFTGRVLGISAVVLGMLALYFASKNNKLDSLMNLFSRSTSRTA